MAISYNKLWKLLIDTGMTKTQLREKTKISTSALAQLGKNEYVSVRILEKICTELNCTLNDIVDFVNVKEEKAD